MLMFQLPLEDPILKFLIILLIILIIPIFSDKLKMPHLLGMIIAGVIIGPHGLNLLARDSSIILSGTVGLLYIMFLAGLEIDMKDFKANALKSSLLGIYGFLIPMAFGILAGVYVLGFSLITAVLLASLFASHTLITYPIVSKLGIAKNRAVNISVGSTLITNILSLLVLAVVVGLTSGEINQYFWIELTVSFIVFTAIIFAVFPRIAHWFFKRYSDNVSQYIFVLVMVFLGAVLSQMAGIEGIIGAFMAGLALNRFIPITSPLMNRIDFVGNAIFIPFFLIGVGMLIDFRAFTNLNTIFVAAIMSLVATVSKFMAAWAAQKNFKFTRDERLLIFGLTNPQAAATLAAVLIGYNIVLGETGDGQPIRLLNDDVLNGTIIMILVTCTIASFATQRSAQKVALAEQPHDEIPEIKEKILIPLSNPNTIDELVGLSLILKSKQNTDGLLALNIIRNATIEPNIEKESKKLLQKAEIMSAATDQKIKTILRYDSDLVHGVTNVIRERNITDLILGLHLKRSTSDSFLGELTNGILSKSNVTTFIYNPHQPIATIKRHVVIVPEKAEFESGFSFWLAKIWNIALNTGTKIVLYGSKQTISLIKDIQSAHPIEMEFMVFADWENLPSVLQEVKNNDNLIIVLSRTNLLSYKPSMAQIPDYLNKHYQGRNFLLVYPSQSEFLTNGKVDLSNPSLLRAIKNIDVIGKTIAHLIRGR